MDDILELVKEAPLPAILLIVTLAFLPCISKIVDSLCGLIFNLVLLIIIAVKWKDIQKGDITIKNDFHGAKLEIGKNRSVDDKSTLSDEDDAKEETSRSGSSGNIINLTKFFKGGQS